MRKLIKRSSNMGYKGMKKLIRKSETHGFTEKKLPSFSFDGEHYQLWADDTHFYIIADSAIPFGTERAKHRILDIVMGESSLSPEMSKTIYGILKGEDIITPEMELAAKQMKQTKKLGEAMGKQETPLSTETETIDQLEKTKTKLLSKVEKLAATRKERYSNMDIASPKSLDEKKLDKEIADIFSEINSIVMKIRALKTQPFFRETDILHGEMKEPKFKVGEFVKYIQGDTEKETWYGEIKKVIRNGSEILYRLDAFNMDYKNMAAENTNEKYEVQLTPVSAEVYEKQKDKWEQRWKTVASVAQAVSNPHKFMREHIIFAKMPPATPPVTMSGVEGGVENKAGLLDIAKKDFITFTQAGEEITGTVTYANKETDTIKVDGSDGKDWEISFQEVISITKPKKDLLKLLIGDNFYKENPDNILGTPYTVSGRFGEVTKYKGKISAVNRINAPLDFPGINKAENPTLSTENESLNEILSHPQAQQNIDQAISGTKEETVIRTVKKRTKATKRIISAGPIADADMVHFEEVFKLYNPEISKDELQVFIWYKEQIGQPLSQKWYQLAGYDRKTPAKRDWVNSGLLAYFRGELMPAYLYYAGNIWERKTALENDKKEIIELYGEKVYENQRDRLANVFKVSYDKRLTLTDSNIDNRLKVLPISKFANTFMVKTLNDDKEFKMKSQPAGGKHPGRPDFLHVGHISDYKKTKYAELSLAEAFQYWMVEYKGEYEIKKDTDYSEIIRIYINQGSRPALRNNEDKKAAEAIWQRKVNITKEEGDRLFSMFLAEWLSNEDIVRIETTWNETYNGYLPVNYNKIPIAFSHGREYRNSLVDVRPEKREAVAFLMNEGSGCLAYDVGVGKTWSALFAIKQFMDAGWCKRPFIVVPNQTYKQWLAEGKGLLPDVKFNDLYNLSADYIEDLRGPDGEIQPVDENSISVLTYEGLEQIGFSDSTSNDILDELHTILDQGNDEGLKQKAKDKKLVALRERIAMLVGRGLKGTRINIEDLGFDFACYDEAHKMKKVFVSVKGEQKADGDREKNPYQIQSGGAPSSIALKGFMLTQYILRQNNYRNVLLLTATPFTNSPLEIFSVLSFIAYHKLRESSLNNLKSFFDTYVNATNELVINAKLKPERKQVVLGFNNLQSLQQLINRFINYKTGEMVRVKRPNKWVLPLKAKVINGETIALEPGEQISTQLPLSTQQANMMADIKAYAEGKISLQAICTSNTASDKHNTDDDDEEMQDTTVGVELDEDALDEKEKAGVRTLRAMSHARNLALSPYLYECSGLGRPTHQQYIETSPKLSYVMDCIASVKKHHERTGTPVSGQIIYMDRGIEYFELIKKYLVKELGFKEHEVGIIRSQMPGGKDAKEKIKMLFLGEAYHPVTGEVLDIPDEERIKVVIGSSTIKEGINLQKHTSVMYDCFLDWNPTDIKQFEGRGWRQGNLFKNIRILYPMMEDSMDIFIFQKLEEKTSRIAEIWDSSGETNTFNLEEFNPAEIKAALISDPVVLAELQLMEDKERLADEIRGVKNEAQRIDKILEAKNDFDNYIDDFKEWVEKYRPAVSSKAQSAKEEKGKEDRNFLTLLKLANDVLKTQTDAEGLPMEYKHSRLPNKKYSEHNPVSKSYYQDDLVLANRTLMKAEKEFLKPKGLTIAKLPKYKESLAGKIAELEKISSDTTSEEAIKLRSKHIIEERKAKKIKPGSVKQRVAEFATLNYLLDEKQAMKQIPVSSISECPPVDENGKLRIDKEALEHMAACLAAQPQTKQLYVDKEGNYTAERKKLHMRILNKFKENVACLKREKPIAILTGGAPGSGKTHFLKNYAPYLLSKEIFHIDADAVRAELPEYKGWNAASTHLETKDIVDEMISDIGKRCKFDVVYDGTMNKAKKYYELIRKLKKAGYEVFVIYIDVPQEVSEERVLNRYQRTGRFVPMDIVQEVFDAGHKGFDQIKTLVKGWILVDGMTGQVTSQGGEQIPHDRSYAKLTGTKNFVETAKVDETDNARRIKLAKAKAAAQKQRLRILALAKSEPVKKLIHKAA